MSSAPPPRMAPLPASEWSEREYQLLSGNLNMADKYLSGRPDAPPMPPILGRLARHAGIGGPWLAFSGALLERGSLGERDLEMLILRVGSRTECRYLLYEHRSRGLSAGLSQEQMEAIAADSGSGAWGGRDQALLRATDELVGGHVVSDATWNALARHFDERQLLEVLFLIGSYTCLAMILSSVGLEPESKEG